MTPSKEEIKNWLKSLGKDREWLAEQCKTGKRAVDKWFEKNGTMPAKAILIIQRLMSGEGQEEGRDFQRVETITLQFSKTEWGIICEYQKMHPGKSIQELAEEFILRITEELQSWVDSSQDKAHMTSHGRW